MTGKTRKTSHTDWTTQPKRSHGLRPGAGSAAGARDAGDRRPLGHWRSRPRRTRSTAATPKIASQASTLTIGSHSGSCDPSGR